VDARAIAADVRIAEEELRVVGSDVGRRGARDQGCCMKNPSSRLSAPPFDNSRQHVHNYQSVPSSARCVNEPGCAAEADVRTDRRAGECSIEQLMKRFGVSGMTVRRDLQSLADQGKVIRTHGGAAMAERISFEFEFLNRVRENHAAKEAIAASAAAQIKDGESVMLDSGTTTLELAKRLRGRRGLTVITSSLPIAAQLQYDQQIEVLLLGGRLRASSPDLAGALTESNLETLRADAAFLGPTPSMATAPCIRSLPSWLAC